MKKLLRAQVLLRSLALICAQTLLVAFALLTGCTKDLESTLANMNALSDSLTGVQEKMDELDAVESGIASATDTVDAIKDYAAAVVSQYGSDYTAAPSGYAALSYEDIDAEASALAGSGCVTYAVYGEKGVVRSAAAGLIDGVNPAAPTALCALGDVSRLYTAAAALMLAQDGALSLDSKVMAYLPEFSMRDNRYANITLRMLLSNTAGLPGFTSGNAVSFGQADPEYQSSLLSALALEYLQCAPGAYAADSTDGFTLAQLVVAQVCGKSALVYLKENMKGLDKTGTLDSINKDAAAKLLCNEVYTRPLTSSYAVGALDAYSTAEELARFGYELLLGGTLTKEAKGEMTKNYGAAAFDPAGCCAQGLGWDDVAALPFAAMGIQAFRIDDRAGKASLIVLPGEKLAVAMLSNSADVTSLAADLAVTALRKEHKTYSVQPGAISEMPEALMEFAGLYAAQDGMTQVRISKNGVLYTLPLDKGEWVGAHPRKYTYRSNGRFSNDSEELYFVKEGGRLFICIASGNDMLLGASDKVLAQKLEQKPLSPAWKARNGRTYLLKSCAANSKADVPAVRLYATDGMGGCITANSLPLLPATDNTAGMFLTIPGAKLPQSTLYFYKDAGGNELMRFAGQDYIYEGDAKRLEISGEPQDRLTPGEVTWFTVAPGGKEYVSYWGGARYIILSDSLEPLYDSLTDGQCELIRMPLGGYIAAMGEGRSTYRIAARNMSEGEASRPAGPYNFSRAE